MIYLCNKYVKNCNIFGQILNIWVKMILKKKIQIFFQCLALPKDPQSFGSQNFCCPFSVSQYYRPWRLCTFEDWPTLVGWLSAGWHLKHNPNIFQIPFSLRCCLVDQGSNTVPFFHHYSVKVSQSQEIHFSNKVASILKQTKHPVIYTANVYRQTTDKLMFKSVISTVR